MAGGEESQESFILENNWLSTKPRLLPLTSLLNKFSNVSCLASWRSLVMGKTVWDLHRNVSRSSRVDTFLHNEDISSNFRSSSEPTLVELLLNGHFRKLQLPPHCHGLDGVPSDTSVTLLLASLSFNPCHFAEQLCRNWFISSDFDSRQFEDCSELFIEGRLQLAIWITILSQACHTFVQFWQDRN